MKKYKISNLEQILKNAGIFVLNIENTNLSLVDEDKLKLQGKSKKKAMVGELDVFAFYKKIVWIIEFTTENKINTAHFDKFPTRIRLLSENNHQKLIEAIDKIWQKYSLSLPKPSDPKDLKLIGLYVNPCLDELQEETLKARIPSDQSKDIFVWGGDNFEYFKTISDTIRRYSKYELFSYFELRPEDIFHGVELESEGGYSKEYSALKIEKGVFGAPMFIFKIYPSLLLKKSYVLRNEGWRSDSFQRMIIPSKLKKIREYIVEKKDASFANNIIVSLAPDIKLEDIIVDKGKKKKTVGIKLPLSFGSLCIIDGQHRLLAFTQDFYREKDVREKKNDEILKKLADTSELIVTTLAFSGSPEDILKKQTQLFRDINATQTKVKSEFIYNLEEIINRKGPKSIGNKVIKYLNKKENGVFEDKFEVKWHQKGRIKRSSIVKWGLVDLVDPSNNFLFPIMSQKIKRDFMQGNVDAYVAKCGDLLDRYFKSIKKVFQKKYGKNAWDFWRKSNFMLLSTSSIVGFLRLYRHFLRSNIKKPKKIVKYIQGISRVNFTHGKYQYTSSQWAKLEEVMFDDIRKNIDKNFGDETLIKRSKN